MTTIKEHLGKIRMAFDDGCAGYRDEDTLRVIYSEITSLKHFPIGKYEREKLGQAEHYADIYFSPRKHRREIGGLPQVREWFFQALDSFESSLKVADLPKK
jgi:hypothetical protein